MKSIEIISEKHGTHYLLLDDDDYDYYNQWTWSIKKGKSTFYAFRNKRINGIRLTHRIHREIMKTPIGLQCDHIDHNGLNCQKSNMRNCTNAQNNRNKSPKRNGSSKYLGVNKSAGKKIMADKSIKEYIYWAAHIKPSMGNMIFLGQFQYTETGEFLAALAYDKAAIIHHKEFANLNFPYLNSITE